jgi:hypothetical protein
MREEWNVYRVLVGNLEGKRQLGRPRRRWENGIRMDFRETGWGSVDWIPLDQDRGWLRALVNTATNLRVLAPRSYIRQRLDTNPTIGPPPVDDKKPTTNHPGYIIFTTVISNTKVKLHVLKLRVRRKNLCFCLLM